MKEKINKTAVCQAIISKIIKERNPKEVNTPHIKELMHPEKIESVYSQKTFVPDIEAVYENSRILYEIELHKVTPSEKWQTFSKYVRNYNGSFYLVVPKNLKEHVKQHLEKEEINAGVITFASDVP